MPLAEEGPRENQEEHLSESRRDTTTDRFDRQRHHQSASKRAGPVSAAGKLKKDEQSVRDSKRVERVIERVKAKALTAGLDPDITAEIYRTIILCFVRKEMKEFTECVKSEDAPDDVQTITE